MARVKRGVTAHKRHKRLLDAAEGRKGAKSRLIKPAREALLHALAYATRDRKHAVDSVPADAIATDTTPDTQENGAEKPEPVVATRAAATDAAPTPPSAPARTIDRDQKPAAEPVPTGE